MNKSSRTDSSRASFTQTGDFLSRVWRLLTDAHPSVMDIGERRRAQLLSALSLILTVSFVWAILSNPRAMAVFIVFLGITIVAYILSRTKLYRISAYFFAFGFTSLAYINIYNGSANGIDSSIMNIVPIALILASAILSQRGFLFLAVATVAATIFVRSYANPVYLEDQFVNLGRTIGITFSIAAILYGITVFRTGVERARLKEIQGINTALEDLTANLENRVNERTAELEKANQQTSRRAAQLQAITDLSEAIAQFQELGEIFPAATNLISRRFGFYHVGIFLVDGGREYVMLQSANSEGGLRMLARGHRLKMGTGVVGFAAQSGQPRIALDVGADAVFFNNPDLPATRSEVALPMKSRGETIGVLDVQSTESGAFSTEDLQVLTALANQVSIALENTRLLTETRAALKQVQEVYNEFTRAEWSRTAYQAEQTGFRYQTGRIEMMEGSLQNPEVISAIQNGEAATTPDDGSKEKYSTVAVPVKLRGAVIGVLHIESNDPNKKWREDEVSLVEAVAERAAFAMENARLFQEARHRAAKESMISEATARISSAANIENILHVTAEELERVLGGSEVLIQFQSKEAQK